MVLAHVLQKLTLVAFGLSFTLSAQAHVKWFVDTSTAEVSDFTPYSFTDTPVLVWFGLLLLVVLISVLLDIKLPVIRVANTKTRHDFIEI